MQIKENGLCIIADRYFSDFPSIRHMSNNHENRPYYLVIRGQGNIFWMVPLSSNVEKYRKKIESDEEKYGNCLYYYIARVKDTDSVFLVGNTIPVTEEYIKKPFTINGVPFVIEDKQDVKTITSKLRRYLAMVRNGKMKPAVDILGIEKKLLNT